MLAFARLPPGAINYAAFQRPAKRPIHPTLVEATLDATGCVGTLFPTPIVPNEITLFIANERERANSRVITCKQIHYCHGIESGLSWKKRQASEEGQFWGILPDEYDSHCSAPDNLSQSVRNYRHRIAFDSVH